MEPTTAPVRPSAPHPHTAPGLATEFRTFVQGALTTLPHRLRVTDWDGAVWEAGGSEPHWSGQDLEMTIRKEAAAKDLLRLDGMRFLERFLEGDVDFQGNLYLLASLRKYGQVKLKWQHVAGRLKKIAAFQNQRRAQVSVKSHYDIPQEALNVYLDRAYMSYSCAMFENPHNLDVEEVKRIGTGKDDDFDSLEKAQWRKFKDAADYISPAEGENLLDVGCGYGGQLVVALENHPFKKVVGWTHSANQAREGRKLLAGFDESRWELNEGDYRQDNRVWDHITSTGMISHVGPRGLVPYVKEVRSRIKTGGRYLHHSLMTAYSKLPLDLQVGPAFNKKYVWPGFHWFTVGEHVKALEENGFQVDKLVNLTFHYAKTTTAWYERMVQHKETMLEYMTPATFRAWQVFLAGITGSYLNRDTHVYRLYCVAT